MTAPIKLKLNFSAIMLMLLLYIVLHFKGKI